VVFDEALQRVSEFAPLPPGDTAIAVAPDPTSHDLPPSPETPETAAYNEPPPAVELALPEETREDAAEEVHGAIRLARLAWGAAFACVALMPVVLIKRCHSARTGPSAPFGPHRSTVCYEGPAELRRELAGPKGGRNHLLQRMKSTLRRRARAEQRGLCS
jgi:hypothetical protein